MINPKMPSIFLKKSILCVIFSLFFTYQVFSQSVQWDSTYRPDIYKSRVEMFKSFHHSNEDIVFLGNSITFWGEWAELLGSAHFKNRGIPGDMTFGVLERLDEVIDGKPAKVFILIGINDIARNVPDDIIISNYKKMIERFKLGSPATKIYFQTLLPTNSSFNKLITHYNKEDHIKQVNAGLKKLTAKEGIVLINLYNHFIDVEGKLNSRYTFDGVHLTKEGYSKWVELLKTGNYINSEL